MRPGLWLFPPNPESHGGSAWLLETTAGSVLIDCPPANATTFELLEGQARRGPGWIVLLGRDGHGRCRQVRERIDWPVVVQEQEAYLLPGVDNLIPFGLEHELLEGLHLLWTPGPSPGAAVLHGRGGVTGTMDGLFCGRLLVPVGPQRLAPLSSPRHFHGPRQRRSVIALTRWLPAGSPAWVASGAGLGALAGEALVGDGARLLAALAAECLASEGNASPGEVER